MLRLQLASFHPALTRARRTNSTPSMPFKLLLRSSRQASKLASPISKSATVTNAPDGEPARDRAARNRATANAARITTRRYNRWLRNDKTEVGGEDDVADEVLVLV